MNHTWGRAAVCGDTCRMPATCTLYHSESLQGYDMGTVIPPFTDPDTRLE